MSLPLLMLYGVSRTKPFGTLLVKIGTDDSALLLVGRNLTWRKLFDSIILSIPVTYVRKFRIIYNSNNKVVKHVSLIVYITSVNSLQIHPTILVA